MSRDVARNVRLTCGSGKSFRGAIQSGPTRRWKIVFFAKLVDSSLVVNAADDFQELRS